MIASAMAARPARCSWLRRRRWLGVAQIETGHLMAPTAAYLLTQSGSRWAAFIDTGPAAAVGRLLEALELCGREPADVQCIALTHCHLDQAGAAGALAALCPNAVVLAHPRGCRHLADPSRLIAKARGLYGDSTFDELFGDVRPVDAKRLRPARDGESFWLGQSEAGDMIEGDWEGGRELRFLHTRGHTAAHMCVLDVSGGSAAEAQAGRERGPGTVFAGDSLGAVYPGLCDGSGRPFVLPAGCASDFDPEEASASVDAVSRLLGNTAANVDTVYAAHFGAVPDPTAAVQQSRRALSHYQSLAVQAFCLHLEDELLAEWISERLEAYLEEALVRHHEANSSLLHA
eukprot:SAG22_NODE_4257_length_1325_cov_1.578303_1_plen_344_part_01